MRGVTFSGRFHELDRCCINPRPGRRIPIFAGGFSEAAYRRGGTVCDGFTFAGGATVMLYSGTGVDTETKLYWGRTRGEVWGQSYPERAYLRDAAGRLVSDWSRFRAP
mgnify:CR=1 FL=1